MTSQVIRSQGPRGAAQNRKGAATKPWNLEDLGGWLEAEAGGIISDAYRRVLLEVNAGLDSFVQWPQRAELLWAGCDRTAKYHDYPDVLKGLFRQQRVTCDARSNGPAIMAYLVAGGQRPKRSGAHEWTVSGQHAADDKRKSHCGLLISFSFCLPSPDIAVTTKLFTSGDRAGNVNQALSEARS